MVPGEMNDFTPLTIGTVTFLPGESGVIDLPVGSLTGYLPVTMSVHVRCGRKPGPALLLTAGIHGDELIGVEILRRLLQAKNLQGLSGTLLIVPVVCMPSFLNRGRYLPDRRDLNRLFPGSSTGSLGSRLANTFVQEVVTKCTHSIDFHGGRGRPPEPPADSHLSGRHGRGGNGDGLQAPRCHRDGPARRLASPPFEKSRHPLLAFRRRRGVADFVRRGALRSPRGLFGDAPPRDAAEARARRLNRPHARSFQITPPGSALIRGGLSFL